MALLAFILGLMLVINPYVPHLGEHTRALDLLSAALLPFNLYQFLRGNRSLARLAVGCVLIAATELPWLVTDWGTYGAFAPMFSTRWLVLVSYGCALALLTREFKSRRGLAFGILLGAAVNALILWLESLGYTAALISMGLAYPSMQMHYVGLVSRYSGLHGNPNAAAAVVSLAIPAAVALMAEFKQKWYVPIFAIGACAEGALCTFSRSAFLIGTVLLVIYLLRAGAKQRIVLGVGVVAVILGSSIAFTADPALAKRWSFDYTTQSNATTRLSTTVESLSAIVKSPLGLGSDFHDFVNFDVDATHNAFTGLALFGGVPLTLLILLGVLRQAGQLLRKAQLQHWMALQLLGVCMFEEHFNNPTFIAIAIWLTLQSCSEWFAAGSPSRFGSLNKPRQVAFPGHRSQQSEFAITI